jgi:hypothetical protein
MVYVMISTTIGIAHLMGVIAVDHALIKSYVLNVCVKLDTLIEFQMYWLKMVSATMKQILPTATLMEETAVDFVSIPSSVLTVNALEMTILQTTRFWRMAFARTKQT